MRVGGVSVMSEGKKEKCREVRKQREGGISRGDVRGGVPICYKTFSCRHMTLTLTNFYLLLPRGRYERML